MKNGENITFSTIKDRNTYIIEQRKKGRSAQSLAVTLQLTPRTINRVVQTYKKTKRLGRKIGSKGSKRLTSPLKLRIDRLLKKDPYITAVAISNRLNNVVSAETIRLYLKSKGYVWKKPSKIPKLSEKDKFKRERFARSHISFPFETTFFTDEATFVLGANTYAWIQKGESLPHETHSHPPKVQLWGAISAEGKAYLRSFTGTMKQKTIKNYLRRISFQKLTK